MELLLIVAGVVALAVFYFSLGILLKFLVAWWVLLFGAPILLAVGLFLGWAGAIGALIGSFCLLHLNNKWMGSDLYLHI